MKEVLLFMASRRISTTQNFQEIIPYRGKEQVPIICMLDLKKLSHKKFMEYCLSKRIYTIKDLIFLCYRDIDEDYISRYSVEKAITHIIAELAKYNIESTSAYQEYKEATECFKEHDQEKFPMKDVYSELINYYGLGEDTDKYRLVVYCMELSKDGLYDREKIFALIEEMSPVCKGARSMKRKEKIKLANDYQLKAEGEESFILDINPVFYALKIKNYKLEEFDQRDMNDISRLYPAPVVKRLSKIYPIVSCELQNFEDELLKAVRKNDAYPLIEERMKGKTFQELGDEKGVSLESIRQRCNVFYDEYLPFINEYLKKVAERNKKYWVLFQSEELSAVFADKCMDVENMNIVKYKGLVMTQRFLRTARKNILDFFGKEYYKSVDEVVFFASTLMDNDMRAGELMVDYLVSQRQLHRRCDSIILNFKEEHPDIADLTAFLIYKYFPNGFKVTDESQVEEFNQHAEEDFGLNPTQGHSLHARLVLDKETFILTGLSTYTHADHVLYDTTYVNTMIAKIIDMLNTNNSAPIGCFYIFEHNKDDMIQAGIKSASMLYGVLMSFYPDDFKYKKYFLYKKDTEVLRTLPELCFDYIKSHEGGVTRQELEQNFRGAGGDAVYSALIQNFNAKYDKDCGVFVL